VFLLLSHVFSGCQSPSGHPPEPARALSTQLWSCWFTHCLKWHEHCSERLQHSLLQHSLQNLWAYYLISR
jgi:hypothetical protein